MESSSVENKFLPFRKGRKIERGNKGKSARLVTPENELRDDVFSLVHVCGGDRCGRGERERAPRVLRIREGINSPKNHQTEPFCHICLDCQVLPSLGLKSAVF